MRRWLEKKYKGMTKCNYKHQPFWWVKLVGNPWCTPSTPHTLSNYSTDVANRQIFKEIASELGGSNRHHCANEKQQIVCDHKNKTHYLNQ